MKKTFTTRELINARSKACKPENRKPKESIQEATRRILSEKSSPELEITTQHPSQLASQIREENESWPSALSRATKLLAAKKESEIK